MSEPAEVRARLLAAGYTPVPCVGKIPVLKGWQKQHDPTLIEIEQWSRTSPAATNTGILTRLTPTLDIDIGDPEAAKAIEDLVRERFEERGNVLVRFGRAPRRCIPFRTDTPFQKMVVDFDAHDLEKEKKQMTDMNARLMALAASYADESKWRWRVDEDSVFPLRALTIELEGCRVEISEMYGLDDEVRGYMWLIAPNDREEIDSDLGQAAFATIAEAKADAFDMLVHCVQTQDEVAAATAAARAAFARCCVLLTDLPPLQKWRVLAALRNWVNETTKNDPFIEQKRNEAFSVGDVYDEPNLSILSL